MLRVFSLSLSLSLSHFTLAGYIRCPNDTYDDVAQVLRVNYIIDARADTLIPAFSLSLSLAHAHLHLSTHTYQWNLSFRSQTGQGELPTGKNRVVSLVRTVGYGAEICCQSIFFRERRASSFLTASMSIITNKDSERSVG